MLQFETFLPTLGVTHQFHIWWLVLAIVVFALVAPLAYLLGKSGGRPG